MRLRWTPFSAGFWAIAVAALLTYHNTFPCPFVFDDLPSIVENATIRHLWPIWPVLSPPLAAADIGRPIVNLSLAVNYALGGTDVRGYHAANVAIHILAGLTLFGIVRRTLGQPPWSGRFGAAVEPLALVMALIWVVHPLQTESVTCVIQRTESLMGLFYLLTLYCFIRGTASRLPSLWYTLSVAACLLGMASKEVMVSAPLMVLLYDRTFISLTFRQSWQRRRWLYLSLGATWILLGYLVVSTGTAGGTRGFGNNVTWWAYALNQFRAIVHYLYLSVWPHPLVVDYGVDLARHAVEIIPYAIIIVLLLVGTVAAIWRWPFIGYAGAWFFSILAPSSSVVPLVTQTMAEHRMYLPLAAVVALVVMGGYKAVACVAHRLRLRQNLLRCVAYGVAGVIVVTLGGLTVRRNQDYRSALSLWADTVAKQPQNARAQCYFGVALGQANRMQEAISHLEQALRLKPDYPEAHNNLGYALMLSGRVQDAVEHYEQALRINPDDATVHNNLGFALLQAGRVDDAIRHCEQALRINPGSAEAHHNLGIALRRDGKIGEAIMHFQEAVRLKPDFAVVYFSWGNALIQAGKTNDAILRYEQALQIKPNFSEAQANLTRARSTQ